MAKSRVKPPTELRYIEHVIKAYGEIRIGCQEGIDCAVIACDDDMILAQLVRRDHESFPDLIQRLDKAIQIAYEKHRVVDEISNGPDYSI